MANLERTQSKPLADHGSFFKRRWSGLLVMTLLGFLVALAIYRVCAPFLTERRLQRASLPELQAASQREPDNPRVFYYLGLRAQQAGQGQTAMNAFWRAANLDPDDEKLWLIWSQTAFNVQGSQAALSILMTFDKIHPQNVLMHLQLARLLDQNGDQTDAYALAQKVTQLAPHNADAWQLLGKTALKLHDANRAETAYRHAVALRPQDSFNYAGLGDALFMTARYPEAADSYREATRLAPEDGTAYMALGQSLLKTAAAPAEIEAARSSLQQALTRPATLQRTGLYYIYLCMGQSYARQDRWKEALSWLKQAETIQPTNPDANNDVHFDLAHVYRALNDSVNAAREIALHQNLIAFSVQVRALDARLSKHPNDTQTGLRLARLYAAHHDYGDAGKTYRAVLSYASDKQAVRQEMAALTARDPGAR